jgi:hypothetical protein
MNIYEKFELIKQITEKQGFEFKPGLLVQEVQTREQQFVVIDNRTESNQENINYAELEPNS